MIVALGSVDVLVAVNASEAVPLKLFAAKKTAESKLLSPTSEIASLIVWGPGERFNAAAVKTSVNPSKPNSVRNPAPGFSLLL